MNADGIRVTAFDVVHRRLALGYRVDYRGRSLIISGDTGFSTNLMQYAKGADVIIREVMAAADSA